MHHATMTVKGRSNAIRPFFADTIGRVHSYKLQSLLPSNFFSNPLTTKQMRQQICNSWEAFLQIALDAIEHFIKFDLSHFDALVGENRCEIRALHLIKLVKQFQNCEQFRKQINTSKLFFEELKCKIFDLKQSFSSQVHNQSLEDMLGMNIGELDVHEHVVWIILLFALSNIKHIGDDHIEKTDAGKLIQSYSGISKGLARRLILLWQKKMSRMTTYFLQHEASQLKEAPSLAKYLYEKHILQDDHGRWCAPGFISLKVILERLSAYRIIIALRVNFITDTTLLNQEVLYYQYSKSKNRIELVELFCEKNVAKQTPIYMIEGCTKMFDANKILIQKAIQLIKECPISTILLSNIAHKPTYSGKNKTIRQTICESNIRNERTKMENLSGFSLDDPSVFCITHVQAISMQELAALPKLVLTHNLPQIVNNDYCAYANQKD